MSFVKYEEDRFRIDGEIAENHAILVNLTASIVIFRFTFRNCISIVRCNSLLHIVRQCGNLIKILY